MRAEGATPSMRLMMCGGRRASPPPPPFSFWLPPAEPEEPPPPLAAAAAAICSPVVSSGISPECTGEMMTARSMKTVLFRWRQMSTASGAANLTKATREEMETEASRTVG